MSDILHISNKEINEYKRLNLSNYTILCQTIFTILNFFVQETTYLERKAPKLIKII